MPFRFVYFASSASFAHTVLCSLLEHGWRPEAVILPATGIAGISFAADWARLEPTPTDDLDSMGISLAPSYVQPTALHTAWAQGVPAFAVRRLGAPAVGDLLRAMTVDVACAACFPYRVPVTLLQIPRLGFLNVHPSLLPNYRGPVPLFWQLRAGEPNMGVTVHWMDADLDKGDIAAQQSVTLSDGLSGPEADKLLAAEGALQLAHVLGELAGGRTPRRAQRPGGSYHSWPGVEDFTVDAGWPARRIFNFMRGTATWAQPYRLALPDRTLWLIEAVAWHAETPATEVVMHGNTAHIRCAPGILVARLQESA